MNTPPQPPAGRPPQASPAVSRHQLGNNLRKLRQARSLRLEDVAASLGVAPSTVCRIETGKAPAQADYLNAMLDIYGIDDPEQRELLHDLASNGQRQGPWTGHHDLLAPGEAQYLDLETAATQIRAHAVNAVPGPLQAQDYAAAALHATRPSLTPAQARALAAIHQRRHAQLLRQGIRLHVIIDEAVLLRTIGTARVMARQLHHLHTTAAHAPVTVQVTRLGAARRIISPPFTMLSLADPDAADVTRWDSPDGKVHISKRGTDLTANRAIFDTLARTAMSPARSADLIDNAAAEWTQRGDDEH